MTTNPDFNNETTIHDVIKEFKPNTEGKTFVITGPSAGGLGAGAAYGLSLGSPKQIFLVGRSLQKIQPVMDKISSTNSSVKVHFVQADFLDLSSVRRAAKEIQGLTDEIHGLINSAGIMAPDDFGVSKDGIEKQFASNHVGHFLLTNLLMPQIIKAKGVVTNVSSGGHRLVGPRIEDINFNNGKDYNPWLAYGGTKSSNVLFSVALTKRLRKHGAAAFSMDPGYVDETPLQKNSDVTQERMMDGFNLSLELGIPTEATVAATVEQGAGTMILTILDPKLRESSGAYVGQCQILNASPHATDPEVAEKLWTLSENLVGEKFTW